MRKLRANTRKPVVCAPVFPNAGVEHWYAQQLDALINESAGLLLHDIAQAWAKTPPLFLNSHIISGDEALQLAPTAAGVIFRTPDNYVLLMHRKDGKGWAFPAGHVELNETAEAAARREAFEETLHAYNGPLEFVCAIGNFAAYSADILEPFTPALNVEHDAFEWLPINRAINREGLHPGVAEQLETLQDTIATDAPSPTKALQAALAKWGLQSIKRFDLMSKGLAQSFASRNQMATQTAMIASLKKAGFAIEFKPTARSLEAYQAVVAENVGLIKSIPRKWHDQVQQRVWNAVRNGSDLNTLSKDLRETYGITTRRAALIARDQNAKSKATIERVRRHELGITKAVWLHSHAGKEPRPTHVKMNNKPYRVDKGMFDPAENKYIWPGELINCRCVDRAVIDGFGDEDAAPEEPTKVLLQAALNNAERFANGPRASTLYDELQRLYEAKRSFTGAEEIRLKKQIEKFLEANE